METMPVQEKILLKNNFISGMRAVKSKYQATAIYFAVNAAGPLAAEIVKLAPKHFEDFWSTGVTVDLSAQSNPCPHFNPTFVYSAMGTKFNVHYGSDPVFSFHLAPIFTSIKDVQRPSTIGIEDLVEGAREQFFSLCSSLKSRLSLGSSSNLTLMDTEHLQLVRERPGNVGELERLRAITSASVPISTNKNATEVWTTVGFDKSGENVSTLTMRHAITAPNARKSLSNLAPVTTKPVSDSVPEVTFDGYKHLFINPFPVRGSQTKTRIARKSFYIEVCDGIRSCRVFFT